MPNLNKQPLLLKYPKFCWWGSSELIFQPVSLPPPTVVCSCSWIRSRVKEGLDRFPTSADEMGTKKQDASLRETNSFMSGQTNSRKTGVKKLALSEFPWKKNKPMPFQPFPRISGWHRPWQRPKASRFSTWRPGDRNAWLLMATEICGCGFSDLKRIRMGYQRINKL